MIVVSRFLRPLRKQLDILWLTIKYFFQGDTWKDANQYAKAIVLGFRR